MAMKFVQKITYDLGDLEYYRDQLGWKVDTIEDVVERLKDENDEYLYRLFGRPTDYECYAEEIKA